MTRLLAAVLVAAAALALAGAPRAEAARVIADIACQQTATAGTGTLSLGAAAPGGYRTLAAAGVASGSQVPYQLVTGSGTARKIETGWGTFTDAATDTLTRTADTSTDGAGVELTLSGTSTVCIGPISSIFTSGEGYPVNADLLDSLSSGAFLQGANNLADVASAAAAFASIKQPATALSSGACELATQAEAEAGTDAARCVTPEGLANYALSSEVTSYTDEQAQDAVGTILSDAGDVDFTYDDLTPAITGAVRPDSVALGTDTTGGYAGSATEGGAADAGDSATGFFAVGTLEDARVDGSLEADELVLAGDVDGAASSNDLDEAAVEAELEGVLDLADLQGSLTVPKGGTGAAPSADDQALVSDSALAATWRALPDSDGATQKLQYDQTTNTFSAGVDDDVPEAADYSALTGGVGIDNSPTGTLAFDATEVSSATWGAGAFTGFTFDAGAVDPVMATASASVTWSGIATYNLDDEAELRLFEEDAGGANYVGFKAPAALTASVTCTLEDDANPIPDSCVGDGVDGGGGGGTPGGADTQVQYNDAGAFGGDAGLAFNETTDALTVGGLLTAARASLAQGTITDVAPQVDGTVTWNDALDVMIGWRLNATDTASAADSLLLDLQKDGTSQFQVTKSARVQSGISFSPWMDLGVDQAGMVTFGRIDQSSKYVAIGNGGGVAGIKLSSDGQLQWSNTTTTPNSTLDLALVRDAAGALAQRSGASAQALRVYNTWTDASNYERLGIGWASNLATIAAEAAGTGTVRQLNIDGASSRMKLGASLVSVGPLLGLAASQANVGVVNTITFWGSANGILRLTDGAQSDFGRLQFGGTTASFPAIKRNAAGLDVRLADDTGYAALAALSLDVGHATDTTLTRSAAGDMAVEGNIMYRAGGTKVALADGGTGAGLADPGADLVMIWDELTNSVRFGALADVATEAAPAAGDFILIYGAEGDLRRADWSTLPAGGSGDSVRVEDGDDLGTFAAAADADLGDGGDINFSLNTTPTPDEITATVRPDSVALGTDTTGSYAAGDAEAGGALTGDSATGFFAAGVLEDARVDGSLEADEVVLAGDVDGAANANDLDEVAAEAELEGVLDLPDLQGTLTAAKGGTGAAPGADDQALVSDSTTAATWRTIPDSDGAGQKLVYDQATNAFSAGTDDDVPEAGDFGALTGGSGVDNTGGTLDFDATELAALTWGSGAGFAWTFDAGAVDPVLTFGGAGDATLSAGGSAPVLAVDDQGSLRLLEEDAGGANFKAFAAPAAITADATCVLEDDASFIPDSCVGDGVDDTGSSLPADPNVNAILGWDDTAGAAEWWDPGTGLTATTTTLNCDTPSETGVGCVELATTAEADAGTDAARAVTPAGVLAAVAGRQTIWVPAAAMKAKVTAGAACGDTYDSGTNDTTIVVCNFDTTTQEFAHFQVAMPKSWNEGTLAFEPLWTNTGGASTQTVVFGLACASISNDASLNVTMGTTQTSTDTWLAQNDLHVGPESAALTCGGIVSEGDMLAFQVNRTVASDNMAGDAALIGVRIYYTTNNENDD